MPHHVPYIRLKLRRSLTRNRSPELLRMRAPIRHLLRSKSFPRVHMLLGLMGRGARFRARRIKARNQYSKRLYRGLHA